MTYKVTYTFYDKYKHEKVFATKKQAKGFFWAMVRRKGVTRAKLITVGE